MRTFETAAAPHLPPRRSVRSVMALVLLALLPGITMQTLSFGSGLIVQIALAVAFAMAFEALMLSLRKQPLGPFLNDLSAPLAGVLFALCLPPLTSWWISLIGMCAAMVLAKHLYGGLGYNLFNPAMVGFAVVLLCFPLELSRWPEAWSEQPVALGDTLRAIFLGITPPPSWDAIAQPTPLDALHNAASKGLSLSEIANEPVFGAWGGRGWEWMALAYAAGGVMLLWLKIIPWQVPAALLGTVVVVYAPLHWYDPGVYTTPWQQMLIGGVMLAAFFIATDPVTGCTTPRGRLVFGAGVALLTLAIRQWGAYPDGVAFAVLLMNCAAPWIDLHARPRIYGERKRNL